MTSPRYYADDPTGHCERIDARQVQHNPAPDRPGLWHGSARVRAVRYRATGIPHVCDRACQTATRPLCECVCGGRNHGRFMRPKRRPTVISSALPLFQEISP